MTELRQQIEDAWTSAENPQSAEPQNVATSEDNQTAPAEPVEVITAPNSYTKEAKDWFSTLPHENQKYLADREKQFEQGLSRARNQYSWVDKIYNDRKDALSGNYENAQAYINDLVLIADALEKDPASTIEALKQNYGLNGSQDNALQRQLSELTAKLNEQQRYLDSQRQERTAQEYQEFVNAKDDKGNSKHPYFEEVKGEMINLLKAGMAKNLEDAYNQAIWRVEEIRNKIIASQTGARLEQKATEAQKAKAASFDPTSKKEATPKVLSLREELERNYDKLME
ncbi:MAG: hypothetical protein IJD90_02840 [Clostridia bacterium]|nr:hypothetical protein [Clostridia bacterium]MBQ7659825.1 hypothetical protein [Alphaproteobacteria bacterium]